MWKYALFLLALVGGAQALLFSLSEAQVEKIADIAPIITALVASSAAFIALTAVHVQRDTAKRRAAIDFFLKTEMDPFGDRAYNEFLAQVPNIRPLLELQPLRTDNDGVKALRAWLNICELIAVGVRLETFSDRVAYSYWGQTLPDSYTAAKPFIDHIRTTQDLPGAEKLGGPSSLCELEWLASRWSGKKARLSWRIEAAWQTLRFGARRDRKS